MCWSCCQCISNRKCNQNPFGIIDKRRGKAEKATWKGKAITRDKTGGRRLERRETAATRDRSSSSVLPTLRISANARPAEAKRIRHRITWTLLAGDSIRSCKFAASLLLVDAAGAFLASVDRSSVLGFFAWSLIRLDGNVIACGFWNVLRPDLQIG
jgi:hypothetical protein